MAHGIRNNYREQGFAVLQTTEDQLISDYSFNNHADHILQKYRWSWIEYCNSVRQSGYKVTGRNGQPRNPHTLEEVAGYFPQYINILKEKINENLKNKTKIQELEDRISGPAYICKINAGPDTIEF